MAKVSKQQQIPQLPTGQRPHPPEAIIVKLLVSFVVAFKQIGVFLPIIAAAMTLLFYFFYPQLLLSCQQQAVLHPMKSANGQEQSLGGFFILGDGLLSALLIAFVYALCSIPVVALVNRGLHDYAFFKMSEEQLCARLGNPKFASQTEATPRKR